MPTVATETLRMARDVPSKNIKHAELQEKVSAAPSIFAYFMIDKSCPIRMLKI